MANKIFDNFWWQGVSAIATSTAVIFAIFQEKIKSYLFKPKIDLCLRDIQGSIIPTIKASPSSGTQRGKVFMHHLQIINQGMRVQAPGIYIIGFREENRNLCRIAPIRLRWAHEDQLKESAIGGESVLPELNFCDLLETHEGNPTLRICGTFDATEFKAVLSPNEKRNIFIRVHASNFTDKKIWEITIDWKGPPHAFTFDDLNKSLFVSIDICDLREMGSLT